MNEFSFYHGKFRVKVFRSISGWQWVARNGQTEVKSSQVFETWRQAENDMKNSI